MALALRLAGLSRGLWFDEYQAIYDFAGNSGFLHTLTVLRSEIHPPLYFWMLQVWRRLGGDGEPYLRLLTVAISMAWMAIAVVWIKTYRKRAALIAALLFATLPFLLRYGQEIKNYGLLLLATILAFYFTAGFVREPHKRRYIVLTSLTLMLAICTHVIAVFLPAAILAFAATQVLAACPADASTMPGRLRDLGPFAAAVCIPPVFVAFLLFRFYFLYVKEQGTWISPPAWDFAGTLARTVVGTWTLPDSLRIAVLALLLLAGVLAVLLGNWRQSLPFLAASVTYVLQAVIYSLLFRSVLVDRYFLPALVLFISWFSVQLASISQIGMRWLAAGCVALLTATYRAHWVRVEAAIPVEGWRDLSRALPAQIDSETPVFLFAPRRDAGIFRLYAPRYPAGKIVDVPTDTREHFVAGPMPGRFAHTVVVIHADRRPQPGWAPFLTEVRSHSARPALIEIFLLGPENKRLVDRLFATASTILGESRISVGQGTTRMARFELPASDVQGF